MAETSIEWLPVPGWPCLASNDGKVRGPSGKVLKPYVSPDGYHHVLVRHRKLRVHHAVLLAFGHPRPPGQECRHLDGDSGNNRLENLTWGTRQENVADKARLGTEPHGEAKPGHRLTVAQVHEIRRDGRSARQVGSDYGVSHTAVLRIRRGDRWKREFPRQPEAVSADA